jgi:uridine kinase
MLWFASQALRMASERPFVVVIGGGTASGKSSIVCRFVAATGAAHLSHDRYYFDAPEPRGHDFDHPDALDTAQLVADVERLKRGESVELPVYSFASHTRSIDTETMHPTPVIVVEGILVLADPRLAALADLRVFVDAPEQVRFERRLRRDMAERGRTEESVRAQYAETVKPNHDRFVQPSKALACVVLDGTVDLVQNVDELVSLVPR